jgi:AraC-like DNA-binding protein
MPTMHTSLPHIPEPGTRIVSPAATLRPFVRHYWLALDNADAQTRILPDGCVDLVFEVAGSAWRATAYGSTTQVRELACTPGAHYLGLRFQPGHSRHFLQACAGDLTNTQADAHDLVRFNLEPLAARVGTDALFDTIDAELLARLRVAPPPTPSAVDAMLNEIEATHGVLRIDALALRLATNPRRLQRQFLRTIGVSAKFYATVVRAGRALHCIAAGDAALADVAAEAGYADQSHMTRDFARLAGATPRTLARRISSRSQEPPPST